MVSLLLAILSSTARGLALSEPAAGGRVEGDDWPQWRYDSARSARSPQVLAPALHLQWSRDLPPLAPAWPDQARLQFDTTYEPVVAGRTMFVASSRRDAVTAYDTRSGAERWRFFAGGPVRFAPLVWEGRVYVVSDDGHLTCLDAATGELRWKFRGGPSDRRVLGNGRLVSTWPARGAPALADGTVYFAAGIWPFMGVFLHALDARTGEVVWTNEGDGSTYMKQPHNADSFAGVAPQGPLAVVGDRLLVPGGRSVPACYDRRTGKLVYFKLAENARRGGYDVAAAGSHFVNGGFAFELSSGEFVGELNRELVLLPDGFAFAGKSKGIVTMPVPEIRKVEYKDKKGKKILRKSWVKPARREIDLPRVECLIQAGGRFYAGTESRVVAVDPGTGAVTWEAPVEGTPRGLVAADDRLFVVTREGRILCFGAEKIEPETHPLETASLPSGQDWSGRVETILKEAGTSEGWAVAWGWGSGGLVSGLLRQSALRIAVVEPEAERAESARATLAACGVYGDRVEVIHADFAKVELPPYFASLMVAEELPAVDAAFAKKVFASLRPYGGRAVLPARLEGAEPAGDLSVLSRPGGIPGAGNWTHEHADAANTRVSPDSVVRAPLGVLWWGGSTHEGILPRHGHGPQPQVLDGRLFIEGVDFLRAMDIYTGRVLWETGLPGLGKLYNNTSHQPGANSSGTNFVSTPGGIYVAYGATCIVLDPATGKKTAELTPPLPAGATKPPLVGTLNVAAGTLVLALDPLGADRPLPKADPRAGDDDPFASVDALLAKLKSIRVETDTFSSSRHLVAMDGKTGRPLWTAAARDGWRHNSVCIGGGRLFAIDRLSGPQLDKLRKPGEKEPPKRPAKLACFDLRSGKLLWERETGIFGTWLSLSEEHDVLMEAGRVAKDTVKDEPKGARAWKASTGEVLWERKEYVGPAMIQGRTVLLTGRACDLLTGEVKVRQHPITGLPVEWTWSRNYGCNTPMASEHLLTFRSGAAGYFDLARDGGTGNFGGFRSSCTNNLVVAGGVLTAPEYTRTCTCGYQNQSSIGLVPMPEAEAWTFWGVTDVKAPVRRLGVNLGAPGDRKEDDVYWIEAPSVGGKSPSVPVSVSADQGEWFRLHSSRIDGALPWVAASGVQGVKSVTVTLDKNAKAEGEIDVRLVFAEPDDVGPGGRVFDVSIQGQVVLKEFDVAAEAGGARRSVIKEFRGVRAGKELKVSFTPVRKSMPILCGLEIRGAWPEPEDVADVPVERVASVDDEPLLIPVSVEREDPDWNVNPRPFYWVAGIASVCLVVLLAIRARTARRAA